MWQWVLDDTDRAIAVACLLVAAGTLLLAIFAFLQFELTRRSRQRQLRAYVFPEASQLQFSDQMNPKPVPPRTGCLGCTLALKNTGQTPAYQLIHWGAMAVRERTREHTLTVAADLIEQQPANIGAGGVLTKSYWTSPLSREDIAGIESGTMAVFVYGRIVYRDAFKRQRLTTYRLAYTGIFPPPAGAALSFCASGNDAT